LTKREEFCCELKTDPSEGPGLEGWRIVRNWAADSGKNKSQSDFFYRGSNMVFRGNKVDFPITYSVVSARGV